MNLPNHNKNWSSKPYKIIAYRCMALGVIIYKRHNFDGYRATSGFSKIMELIDEVESLIAVSTRWSL